MKNNFFIILFLFFLQTAFAQQYKMPVTYVSSLQPAQSGMDAVMCNDNNVNTLYHSGYNLSTAIPDQLNFNFSNRVKSINKLIYKPRLSGTVGIWTSVKISYSTQSNPAVFTTATGVISWVANNTAKTIDLPTPIIHPAVIRVDVLSAQNNYSTCAEMEFYSSEQMDPVQTECTLATSEFAAYTDIQVLPLVTGSVASSFQPGANIQMSFDGDFSTIYHSNWNGTAASFPISLTYRFNGQTAMNYLKYTPRQNGENGFFGNVKISYNTVSNPTYIDLLTQNFAQTGTSKTVIFPSTITPLNVKIEVLDGKNNFASCAEMEFFRTNPNGFNSSLYSNLFNDSIFSTLKPSVTQQDINAITSPFIKGLAQCLLNNTYNKKYRVQTFSPYKTTESINSQYKIGNYNGFENPTGIAFQSNTTAIIFAQDITNINRAYLKIRDFATEGSSSSQNYYELKNGLNIIEIKNAGLGYIAYYTDDANAVPISLNITAGIVNGMYKKGTTSTEWAEMLTNNVYPKIDIEGYYTKLVIDKFAVSNFHFTTAQPLIDKYDVIAKSEREMMGFFKFNKNFKNRQLVYTESSGGWFAGGLGAHLDLSWGLSNSTSATGFDLWGITHELGHINQIRPGLKWIGTTEITNNLYSLWAYYNLYSPTGTNRFTRLEGEIADQTAFPKVAGNRFGEIIIQTQINGNNIMDQFGTNYANPTDAYFRSLVPFWQLELYYQLAGASKGAPTLAFDSDMSDEDIQSPTTPVSGIDYAHWLAIVAEKVRTTDESQLTQGQLVMNFVKNTCDAVQEDLTDFFTNTGFLKPINATLSDYTTDQLTITQSMIDDTKAYVLMKGYAKPVSPVINYLSANSLNSYKNLLPVSGVTGIGVQLINNAQGRFLLVNNSQWSNAVAFETYDINNQLISVSIVGTGDTTLANTYVDFPSNAVKVYAVGYNGQKILVYPTNMLGVEDVKLNNNTDIIVYPNPLKNGQELVIDIKNSKENLKAEVYDMTGKLFISVKGSLKEINEGINNQIQNLKTGIYIISINDGKNRYQSKIIKE